MKLQTITVSVAGTAYQISAGDAPTERASDLPKLLQGFVTNNAPDFFIEVVKRLPHSLEARMPAHGSKCIFGELSSGEYFFRLKGLRGHVSLHERRALLETVILNDYQYLPDSRFLITRLWLLVLLRILHQGGIAMHSSAVSYRDKALVFFGPSGIGKSTIAEMLSGTWQTMSEEVNILMPGSDGVRVYSTPFSRSVDLMRVSNVNALLGGLFRIEQSTTNILMPLSAREVYFYLAGNSYFLPDHVEADAHLSNCHALLDSSTMHGLRFSNASASLASLKHLLEPFLE